LHTFEQVFLLAVLWAKITPQTTQSRSWIGFVFVLFRRASSLLQAFEQVNRRIPYGWNKLSHITHARVLKRCRSRRRLVAHFFDEHVDVMLS
jgi:hypothetical protein